MVVHQSKSPYSTSEALGQKIDLSKLNPSVQGDRYKMITTYSLMHSPTSFISLPPLLLPSVPLTCLCHPLFFPTSLVSPTTNLLHFSTDHQPFIQNGVAVIYRHHTSLDLVILLNDTRRPFYAPRRPAYRDLQIHLPSFQPLHHCHHRKFHLLNLRIPLPPPLLLPNHPPHLNSLRSIPSQNLSSRTPPHGLCHFSRRSLSVRCIPATLPEETRRPPPRQTYGFRLLSRGHLSSNDDSDDKGKCVFVCTDT